MFGGTSKTNDVMISYQSSCEAVESHLYSVDYSARIVTCYVDDVIIEVNGDHWKVRADNGCEIDCKGAWCMVSCVNECFIRVGHGGMIQCGYDCSIESGSSESVMVSACDSCTITVGHNSQVNCNRWGRITVGDDSIITCEKLNKIKVGNDCIVKSNSSSNKINITVGCVLVFQEVPEDGSGGLTTRTINTNDFLGYLDLEVELKDFNRIKDFPIDQSLVLHKNDELGLKLFKHFMENK